jgi:hypothetical protein
MRYEDKTQMKRGMSAFSRNHKKIQRKVWKDPYLGSGKGA